MSEAAFQRDSRKRNLDLLAREQFDVLIVGGGINGAGIARDLALRSRQNNAELRMALVEKNHFASGTSGKNSQLIHGGLRYLKNFEFGLVREALHERATLLKIAPRLVRPLQFLIPCYGKFDRWFYRTGLLLYDALAGKRSIGRHRSLSPAEVSEREPALSCDGLRGGLTFFDCGVNSARLVLENIFEAARLGTVVANYTAYDNGHVLDTLSGARFPVRARKIVNATGSWTSGGQLRLVRGSHLIVPRVTGSSDAIAYFEPGGRVVFVIPWGEKNDLSLVGTTDVDHSGNPDDVHIAPEEIDYLMGVVRRLFPDGPVGPPISTYSSLRPLIRDASDSPTKTSREHKIWEKPDGVLHIAGGKYTTYRAMSEELVDRLCAEIAPSLVGQCTTANTPLSETDPRAVTLRYAAEHEMAQTVEDYLYVSTYRGYEQRWDTKEMLEMKDELAGLGNSPRSSAAVSVERA